MSTTNLDFRKSRLEDVLGRLIDQAQKLLAIFDQENDCLVAPQRDLLHPLVKEKEFAVRELQRLSQESEDLKDALWQRLGERLPSPPFDQFLARIGEDHAARVANLYAILIEVIKRLTSSHHRNASLLRHALFYNRTLLQMLVPDTQGPTLVDARR